jgi:hypothetical protein
MSMEIEILRGAWSSFRSRPLVWLLVSAASVPYVFALSVGAPDIVFIAGFLATFVLMFLVWCMAAYAYGGEPEAGTRVMLAEAREVLAYQWMKFLNLSVMFGLGVFAATYFVLPLLLNFIVQAGKISGGLGVNIIFYYFIYILISLLLTLFVLAPQLAMLRHDFEDETTNPSGIFRKSYEFTKERYKRALPLVLLPELVARTAMLLFTFLLLYARDFIATYNLIVIPALLVLALIEGARTAYIAAAFNLFLDVVEEEEKVKKKKKPAKAAVEQKKTETRKALPSSSKKKTETKKSVPSPHKKKK